VYSGTDLRQPHSYINLNTVSEPVLAAIFNINTEEATALAAKRPFTSWDDAVQKVGREPATFSVASAQYATRDMPADLALNSRCFRLESLVTMEMPGGRTASAGVEAVVSFLENGTYSIRYWREIKSGAAKAASEVKQ
jgi:type II secretory pathway component PulK